MKLTFRDLPLFTSLVEQVTKAKSENPTPDQKKWLRVAVEIIKREF